MSSFSPGFEDDRSISRPTFRLSRLCGVKKDSWVKSAQPPLILRILSDKDQTLGAIKHPLYLPGGTASVLALANYQKWAAF
jgi:hypothetical protein